MKMRTHAKEIYSGVIERETAKLTNNHILCQDPKGCQLLPRDDHLLKYFKLQAPHPILW